MPLMWAKLLDRWLWHLPKQEQRREKFGEREGGECYLAWQVWVVYMDWDVNFRDDSIWIIFKGMRIVKFF